MELSSYFRINARNTGQFERTLIIADDDAYVSYLEGCTAPMRDENQLHAAIVEIVVNDRAEVKYSTVQNWYPGDEHGKGGVLNLVTKRGDLRGTASKLSWTQVETGSAITWKYPSCVLRGDGSQAGILFRRRHQQLSGGGHRYEEDDTYGEEHQIDNHLERHIGRTQPELPTADSCVPHATPTEHATTRRATRCCSVPTAGRTPSLTWTYTTTRQWWSTRRRHRKSPRTSSSTATSEAYPPSRR